MQDAYFLAGYLLVCLKYSNDYLCFTDIGAIGWIAGVGQAGSAMVPFMVGAIAQNSGIQTLQPMCVSLITMHVASHIHF
jgi:uncharacterized ion transporter superfamily protein YfcC